MRYLPFFLLLLTGTAVLAQFRPTRLSPTILPALQLQPLLVKAATPPPGGTYRTTAECVNACVLPVRWLELKGDRRNDSVCVLEWKTTNEANNLGFAIERSLGNTFRFQEVGFVPAAQQADEILSYHFTDANDYSGITYYRLRQKDSDNQFSYSKTIAVKGYTKKEGLTVYPNPAQHQLRASVVVGQSGRYRFQLLDATGKVVVNTTVSLQKGSNQWQWPIASLPRGAYLLQTTGTNGKTLTATVIRN